MTTPLVTDIRFFAVRRDDKWANVLRNVSEMHSSASIGMFAGSLANLDFFDTLGRQLQPEIVSGELKGFRSPPGAADVAKVRDRLINVVDHLRTIVDARLSTAPPPKPSRQDALNRLPALADKPLPTCFEDMREVFGHVPGGTGILDSGSFWHNFWFH